jgi:hypothetical protein
VEFLNQLPLWAAVLLGLLAGAVLVALNLGWLLSAKAMLDQRSRGAGAEPDPLSAELERLRARGRKAESGERPDSTGGPGRASSGAGDAQAEDREPKLG